MLARSVRRSKLTSGLGAYGRAVALLRHCCPHFSWTRLSEDDALTEFLTLSTYNMGVELCTVFRNKLAV